MSMLRANVSLWSSYIHHELSVNLVIICTFSLVYVCIWGNQITW
jgi:hypothetical protein